MNPNIQNAYEPIAKLFYAVALDEGLQPQQLSALKKLIADYWVPKPDISGDGEVSDQWKIFAAFDMLQKENIDKDRAYRDFDRFYMAHRDNFTPDLRRLILHIAFEITEEFGRHSGEELMMAELRKRLYPNYDEIY